MQIIKFVSVVLLCVTLVYFIMFMCEFSQKNSFANVTGGATYSFPVDVVLTFRGEIFDLTSNREGYNYEIKYCLRSISKNMPWVRRIYILQNSDANVPSFFSANYRQNGIYLFGDDQVIPAKYLPTTNSDSIETFLTLLPGLSENFIYFNDDWFVMKPVPMHYFFTSGGVPKRIIENRRYLPSTKNVMKTPPSPGESVWYPHVPTPYTKTEINTYLDKYPEFIEYTRSIRSRKNLDKSVCYDLGLTFPCMQLHTNVSYNSHQTNGKETEKEASDYLEFPRDIAKISKVSKKFLCVNDQFEGSLEERSSFRNTLNTVMESVFPDKSWAEL